MHLVRVEGNSGFTSSQICNVKRAQFKYVRTGSKLVITREDIVSQNATQSSAYGGLKAASLEEEGAAVSIQLRESYNIYIGS
jgi:hypothetical protein